MAAADGGHHERRRSDPAEADRQYTELLQEMRVAQTGVQFLFAFLLSLAFTQRFGLVTDFQLWLYVGTLITASASAAPVRAVPSRVRCERTAGEAARRSRQCSNVFVATAGARRTGLRSELTRPLTVTT